jgi:hypothetical protein
MSHAPKAKVTIESQIAGKPKPPHQTQQIAIGLGAD